MNKSIFEHNYKTNKRNDIIWNSASGIIDASQTVILLFFITRLLGEQDAGIFSLAYSIAVLMLTISRYGMRTFQVTDIHEKYDFNIYLSSRIVTTFLMLLVCIINVGYDYLFQDYSLYKVSIILLVCILKSLDGIEDVFHAQLQQKNKLGFAAKMKTYRLTITIITQIICLLMWHNLLWAIMASVFISCLFFLFFLLNVYDMKIFPPFHISVHGVSSLLLTCFPLFAARFLSIYMSNIPKYSIDSQTNDIIQARYGFIFMPVYIVNVVGQFIFQPVLLGMAKDWSLNKIDHYIRTMKKLIGIVLVLTLFGCIACYFLGIPILSWYYHTDLSAYKKELILFMIAGGFLATVTIWNMCLTIAKRQQILLFGYGITVVVEKLFADKLTSNYGLTGAVWLYLGSVAGLCMFLTGMMVQIIRKKSQNV